jgi:uncharacterized protein (TIGR02996 family)
MQAAVLNLARGNLVDLKRAIKDADLDFRDVLYWGEGTEFPHLTCVVCPPSEGPADPVEEAFLEAIRANPRDKTARLVYADWLEERGDPRAEYLRVLCAWLACRRPDGAKRLIEREGELRANLDRGWLARIRGMAVLEKAQR